MPVGYAYPSFKVIVEFVELGTAIVWRYPGHQALPSVANPQSREGHSSPTGRKSALGGVTCCGQMESVAGFVQPRKEGNPSAMAQVGAWTPGGPLRKGSGSLRGPAHHPLPNLECITTPAYSGGQREASCCAIPAYPMQPVGTWASALCGDPLIH